MSSSSPFDAFVVHMRSTSLENVIQRLMQISLLKKSRKCQACSSLMELVPRESATDKFAWRCTCSGCGKRTSHLSIRKDSIFEGSKLSLADIFAIIFCWATNKPSTMVSTDFEINYKRVVELYSKLRTIVARHIDSMPFRLGGPGTICQIDESLFCHKVKAHRGRAPQAQVWVFGIMCTSSNRPRLYLEVVENRSAETLLPIISRVVLPGTVVHSDEWKAYKNINTVVGLEHKTVNHSVHFVQPITNTHTQNIESAWNNLKIKIKQMRGIRRTHLEAYLKEFMWRDSCPTAPYYALFSILAEFSNWNGLE